MNRVAASFVISLFPIALFAQDKLGTRVFLYVEKGLGAARFTNTLGHVQFNTINGELKVKLNTDDFNSNDPAMDSLMERWNESLTLTAMISPDLFKLTGKENSNSYTSFEGVLSTRSSKTKVKGYFDILRLNNSTNTTLYNIRIFLVLTFDANALACPLISAQPLRLELIDGEINFTN